MYDLRLSCTFHGISLSLSLPPSLSYLQSVSNPCTCTIWTYWLQYVCLIANLKCLLILCYSLLYSFVYWTLPDDSAITLQQLDLRDPTSTQTLTTTMQRRRRKRQDIATLSLTSALTLDPATGWLWVCDADTGDLLSCDPASVNCTVEVAASDLTPIAMGNYKLHTRYGLPYTLLSYLLYMV